MKRTIKNLKTATRKQSSLLQSVIFVSLLFALSSHFNFKYKNIVDMLVAIFMIWAIFSSTKTEKTIKSELKILEK